ncbi:hypothetical protein CFP56_013707 [Quercus suber]|uniref:Uncharacterized protein n=1 Tax=Quercus suber TaxID=58331 RepID=A0AAW0KSV0_QUESU
MDFEKFMVNDEETGGYVCILGRYSPKYHSKVALKHFHLEDLLTTERFQTQAMEVKEKVFSKFLKYGDKLFGDDDTDDTSDENFIKMRSEWDSFKHDLERFVVILFENERERERKHGLEASMIKL